MGDAAFLLGCMVGSSGGGKYLWFLMIILTAGLEKLSLIDFEIYGRDFAMKDPEIYERFPLIYVTCQDLAETERQDSS